MVRPENPDRTITNSWVADLIKDYNQMLYKQNNFGPCCRLPEDIGYFTKSLV